MAEYFELHISRKNLERIIFISAIIILFLITIFAWKRIPACPEIECSEESSGQIESPVATKTETTKSEPEKIKEVMIYYADIANFKIAPPQVRIREGSTIIFTNEEVTLVHKLYEVKGLFLGPRMEPGDEFNFTFNTAGNYTIWSIMGKDKGTKIDVEVIK